MPSITTANNNSYACYLPFDRILTHNILEWLRSSFRSCCRELLRVISHTLSLTINFSCFTRRYRGSRIELKPKPVVEKRNANATAPVATTPRPEPRIQMKRPSELRPAMGLKESLIQITDQLRQSAIKSETVQSTAKVHMAKKPAPKSNQQEEIIIYETSGNGVALPLTMEDIEREMAQVEFQLQESTPKEGISTWILLSGTETTPQPNAKGPTYAVESESEKKMESDKKMDKIMKVKDDKEIPVLLPKRRPSTQAPPLVRVKPKKATTTTTTTTTSTTTEAPAKSSLKPKVNAELRVNVKRPRRPTTTTTTTEAPETVDEEIKSTEEPADDHHRESSTFLIIEPKDSEFDLPADRSPIQGKKKTAVSKPAKKTKKKPDVKNKKKPGLEQMLEEIVTAVEKPGKTPNKNKEKPISTQIMNYLSREVMPTVGVGIVGLVAAAGIATYFLGSTFTPLRRNDRTDEIYYNNNEEYAGPDNGQYEEEWFSKVIAGSPTYRNSLRQNYKPVTPAVGPNGPSIAQQNYAVKQYPQYSKYARPPPPQGPQGPQGPYPVNPNHRNYNVRPNFGPQNYRINAGPSMPSGANPSELVRKHSMAMPQNYPHHQQYHHAPPPQAAAPPQFAEPAKEPNTQGYFSEASKRHSFSSGASEILAETPQEPAQAADGPIEDNNFLKRTSQASALSSQQFVVGSVYPEALTAKDSPMPQTQAESVPEHGPRRRRRRGAVAIVADPQLRKKTKKLDDNELDNENELPIEELEQIANVQVATDNAVTTVHEHETSSSSTTTTTSGDLEESVKEQEKVPTSTSKVTYYETETISSGNSSFGDFFRRMFTLKLKLGISFLRGMADGVAKYLHQVEERVYRSRL